MTRRRLFTNNFDFGVKMKKKITAAISVALATVILLAALQGLLIPKYIDNREGNLVGEYYSQAGQNDVLFLTS